MLDRGRQHDVGVGERGAPVSGDDDDVGGVEGLARGDDVQHVPEEAPAEQQEGGLLTGADRLELGQCVAADALGVEAATRA